MEEYLTTFNEKKVVVDQLAKAYSKNCSETIKLVHRLDKKTSGLMILAKQMNYARWIGTLFQKRDI